MFFYAELRSGSSETPMPPEFAYNLRLLKAFIKIRDRKIQRKAVELIEALAALPTVGSGALSANQAPAKPRTEA